MAGVSARRSRQILTPRHPPASVLATRTARGYLPEGGEYGADPDTTEAPRGSPARGANARSGRARELRSCSPRTAPTGVGRPLRLSCAYGRPGDGHRGPRAGDRERRARDGGACRDRRRARAVVQETGRVRAVRAQREADPARATRISTVGEDVRLVRGCLAR